MNKGFWRWPVHVVCGLALSIFVYLIAAWIGSSLPRNADWQEPRSGGIVIAVESNGVHTSLLLPIQTAQKNWRDDFPTTDVAHANRPYTHVSISWGEHDVFLNTPTWWDLSPFLVLKILTKGGEGLLHVSFYVRPAASDTVRTLRLSEDQYAHLIATIEAQLPKGRPLKKYAGYGGSDVFYDAGGRYTAIHTCNQWTSNRLAEAGVTVGHWTPLQGGVMKWFKVPQSTNALNASTSYESSHLQNNSTQS